MTSTKRQKTDALQQRLLAISGEHGPLGGHIVLDPSDTLLLRQAVMTGNSLRSLLKLQTEHTNMLAASVASQYPDAPASAIVDLGKSGDVLGLLVWAEPEPEPAPDPIPDE